MTETYILETYIRSSFHGNSTIKEEFADLDKAIKAFKSADRIGVSSVTLKKEIVLMEYNKE